MTLLARIPAGWHLYSLTQPPGGPIATTLELGPSSLLHQNGTISAPAPVIAPDPNFGIESEWYQDSATFVIPARISGKAPQGTQSLQLRVGYQTCNARYCLPPTEDTLSLALTVSGPSVDDGPSDVAIPQPTPPIASSSIAPAARASASPDTRPTNDRLRVVNATSSRGELLAFLWLAATMGALSLLTPCVFPMVPITISYFSRRGQVSTSRALGDALLYAGGTAVALAAFSAARPSIPKALPRTPEAAALEDAADASEEEPEGQREREAREPVLVASGRRATRAARGPAVGIGRVEAVVGQGARGVALAGGGVRGR